MRFRSVEPLEERRNAILKVWLGGVGMGFGGYWEGLEYIYILII